MTLSRTFQVGGLRCHTLEGGLQRLDGGAMFGVVPYPLWSKRVAADERQRIPLAMRCLLVEHPDGLVLIDTGLGNKEDAKFLDIYGVENQGLEGATQLEDALASAGFLPTDVRWVINTHLHFDHAGGNTTLDPELEDDPPAPRPPLVSQRDLRGAAGGAGVRPAGQRAHPRELSPAQLRADRGGRPVAAAGGGRGGAAGHLGAADARATCRSTRSCCSGTAGRRPPSWPT